MFAEMMKSDKGIREAHFPVTYCDKFSNKIGEYVLWPNYEKKWDISPEQKKVADEIFAKRRERQIAKASRPGVLCLITMGCEFRSNLEGGIGNYRVRGRFYDKSGNRWFVEFATWYKKNSTEPDENQLFGEIVDETFNEKAEERFRSEYEKVKAKYGSVYLTPINEVPEHPAYWCEHFREESFPYTRKGIIDFINKRFGTDFTELHIEEYFFDSDTIVSKCK